MAPHEILGISIVQGLKGSPGLVVTLALIALLIGKEFLASLPGVAAYRWTKRLHIGAIPLLALFGVIVALKLLAIP